MRRRRRHGRFGRDRRRFNRLVRGGIVHNRLRRHGLRGNRWFFLHRPQLQRFIVGQVEQFFGGGGRGEIFRPHLQPGNARLRWRRFGLVRDRRLKNLRILHRPRRMGNLFPFQDRPGKRQGFFNAEFQLGFDRRRGIRRYGRLGCAGRNTWPKVPKIQVQLQLGHLRVRIGGDFRGRGIGRRGVQRRRRHRSRRNWRKIGR